jgi:N-dimethylarginine dimethylaminohydrolase
MVYTRLSAIDFDLTDCPAMPAAGRILLTRPDHFSVDYVINPHMVDFVGDVDRQKAISQWNRLRDAYESAGLATMVVEGVEDLPDMVFCANQTLPFLKPNNGERGVILSRMHAEQRRGEVPYFETFFRGLGYHIHRIPADIATDFEGMGDAIWHTGRFLLWGGYGFRTSPAAYEFISRELDVRVIRLRLEDPDFYHLDTAFCVLDERTVLIYREAFDQDGIELIEHFFERVIEAPEEEARSLFACNAHTPDGKVVFIHPGSTVTMGRLAAAGYTPVEVDTSEYLKSGGSVFCMKLAFW